MTCRSRFFGAATGRVRRGFTLVELLVVITIIAILLGLTLPAVNIALEMGRQATCGNNVSQLAKAMQAHESTMKHFPTGGWGSQWMGDPDRGFGRDQPGGWMYNILPQLGEQGTYENAGGNNAHRAAQSHQTYFHCPARRKSRPYDNTAGASYVNAPGAALHARSDYAACAGSGAYRFDAGPGP